MIDQLAKANLKFKSGHYRGCPVVYFEAIEDIQPGAQLLYPYSNMTFWPETKKQLGIERRFFTKDGSLIDYTLHENIILHHPIGIGKTANFTSHLARAYVFANRTMTQPQFNLTVPQLIHTLGYDPRKLEKAPEVLMTIGEHTIYMFRLMVSQYANSAYEQGQKAIGDYLQELYQKIEHNFNMEEVYADVKKSLWSKKPEHKQIVAALKPLKDLVIRLLNNYNQEIKKLKAEREQTKRQSQLIPKKW